ncbi:hypothetical protein PoB_000768000, partial [Plakobranchus ocellatus]
MPASWHDIELDSHQNKIEYSTPFRPWNVIKQPSSANRSQYGHTVPLQRVYEIPGNVT